jgi:acyl dehydratase
MFGARTHQSFLMDESARWSRQGKRPPGDRRGAHREPPPRRRWNVAEVSFQNYHTDRELARQLGFPDIVVQGMLSTCFLSELLTRRFGEGWYCGGRMMVNLVAVLWPDEPLACRAAVKELTPEGARRRAHLEVWCEKADGTKTIVGTASAVAL